MGRVRMSPPLKLTDEEWSELLGIAPGEFVLSIIHSLSWENRFFVDERFLKLLYEYATDSMWQDHSNQLFEAGKSFYRARIYKEPDAHERLSNPKRFKPFQGYDEDNSFVPRDKRTIAEGRLNPADLMYLYTCSDQETAILEKRAQSGEYVSVATIKNTEKLCFFDISKNWSMIVDSDDKRARWYSWFYLSISSAFHAPKSKLGNYYFTQYVSEFLKNIGFDGIAFSSSMKRDCFADNEGINYTIFNYDKCMAVSSELVHVVSVKMKTNPALKTLSGEN